MKHKSLRDKKHLLWRTLTFTAESIDALLTGVASMTKMAISLPVFALLLFWIAAAPYGAMEAVKED